MSIIQGRLRMLVDEERFGLAFAAEVDAIGTAHRFGIGLDDAALRRAVARWRNGEAARLGRRGPVPSAGEAAQRQLVVDEHGRMVRELLAEPDLLDIRLPAGGDTVVASARAWPVGFCIYVAMMALCRQSLGEPACPPSGVALDPRTWWSIRENVAEDMGCARPFLAYLLGLRPIWHDWSSEPLA